MIDANSPSSQSPVTLRRVYPAGDNSSTVRLVVVLTQIKLDVQVSHAVIALGACCRDGSCLFRQAEIHLRIRTFSSLHVDVKWGTRKRFTWKCVCIVVAWIAGKIDIEF